MIVRQWSLALAALLIAPGLAAQNEAQPAQDDSEKPKEEKWDVAAPPLETRDVPIDVTEGTWMSLDVSPDGRMIAFDLLGDIQDHHAALRCGFAGRAPRRV